MAECGYARALPALEALRVDWRLASLLRALRCTRRKRGVSPKRARVGAACVWCAGGGWCTFLCAVAARVGREASRLWHTCAVQSALPEAAYIPMAVGSILPEGTSSLKARSRRRSEALRCGMEGRHRREGGGSASLVAMAVAIRVMIRRLPFALIFDPAQGLGLRPIWLEGR